MRVWLALLGTLPLLVVGSGATASTSAPPRNGLIAFQSGDGIYIVDPSADEASLVPESANLTDPAWSPDGGELAVTAWGQDGSSVYTMKQDGSRRMLVLRNASSPSWSPDGKQLVVVRNICSSSTPCAGDPHGATRLAIVNADGTDARELSTGTNDRSTYASSPEWSPDGKLIAFIDGSGSLALTSPEGERVPLASAPIESSSVSWSPDSSQLAYDRHDPKSGDPVVVVFDRATGKETTFRGTQRGAEAPVWSPEGDQIVFNSMDAGRPTTTPSCSEHFAAHLWLAAPDGTNARQLVAGHLSYGPASWARAVDTPTVLTPPTADDEKISPSCSAVAPKPSTPTPTASDATPAAPQPSNQAPAKEPSIAPATGAIAVRGEGGIWLVDPQSAKTHKLPGTTLMYAPAWSPDGRLLAVEKAEKGGTTGIYTIRPNGTHAQLVLPNASLPSWSAAGDRIFAVRNECKTACDPEDDDADVLYAVNLDGSNLQRVDYEDADVYDSRALAWPTDGSAIHFFDEESLDGPGSFDSSAATWSPDGTQLLFAGNPATTDDPSDRVAGLWIVSADGGKPQLLLRGASGRPSWVAD